MGRWLGYFRNPRRDLRKCSRPEERVEVKVRVLSPAWADSDPQFCYRTEALKSFKHTPFFATWDPLSLELYVECQLWENKETGEARLKMSSIWVGGRSFVVCRYILLIVPGRRAQCLLGTVDHLRHGTYYRCSMTESR